MMTGFFLHALHLFQTCHSLHWIYGLFKNVTILLSNGLKYHNIGFFLNVQEKFFHTQK